MLNREKYAKEIMDIACEGDCFAKTHGIIIPCEKIKCELCDFAGPINDPHHCEYKRLEWANSEYVEPPVDWSKVPVDTPILVRNEKTEKWIRRYFAKYENGLVYTWTGGTTSWSAYNPEHMYDWKYAMLPESED